MNVVDTHTHIYLNEFESDFDQMIQRALHTGVNKMLLPNIESGTLPSMMRSVNRYPTLLYPMIGLHPSSVTEDFETQLSAIRNFLTVQIDRCVAIGETGIDLYWDASTLEWQIHSFESQIRWALEWSLPIVIHCRNAFQEIFKILEPFRGKNLTGVFHCFTGSLEEAKWIIDFGLHLGIGGVLTYKKSNLPSILKNVPKDKIVLETDAPYLSPMPYRGKRNEPSFIIHTLKKLAEIWETSPDEVAEITSENARNLFPKAWK